METGLNLQIADTLIRIDNVWSPGRFEQGLARVNRPDLKSDVDPRMATGLFMYYITVDRTIDVLKTARLTSYVYSYFGAIPYRRRWQRVA